MDVDKAKAGFEALGYDLTDLRWDEWVRVYQRDHDGCSAGAALASAYAAADAPVAAVAEETPKAAPKPKAAPQPKAK